MTKTAIFGGTFNPPHLGHLNCIKSVYNQVNPDRIIIMPDRIPPHKQALDLASGSDRLNMCKMAFENEKFNVQVSDWELNQSGKSYSVLMLKHFRELYKDDKLSLVMGSDMLLSFEQWYRWEEILTLAELVCVSRNSLDNKRLEASAERLRSMSGEVTIVEAKPIEISSTQLRQWVKEKNFEKLYSALNKSVAEYILKNRLYSM